MQNKTVSVFETNIRVLGGLLSAHLIASDYATVRLFYHVHSFSFARNLFNWLPDSCYSLGALLFFPFLVLLRHEIITEVALQKQNES